MISSPLLKRVAESIVIFLPIFQTGCESACSGVTFANCDLGRSRSAPPLAVKMSFLIYLSFSPSRQLAIAECSVSRGIIFPPYFFSRAFKCLPAATMLSLFAIARVPPRFNTATADQSPAMPLTAETTISAGISASSSSEPRHFVFFSSSRKSKSELCTSTAPPGK